MKWFAFDCENEFHVMHFEKIFVMQRRFFEDALLKMNFKEIGTRLVKVNRLTPRGKFLLSASGFNTQRTLSL